MGLLDHRRTWHYDVAASPRACIDAFTAAFSGKGGLIAKAKWDIRSSGNSATATYQGRKGFGAMGKVLSGTSAQEADTAVGSQVSFKVDGATGGRTQCSMALASSGRSGVAGTFGATSDARFIRPYMQAVSEHIRALDANARIETA